MWRFYSQKHLLWSRVVRAIHGVDGGVGKVVNSASHSCWRNIVKEVHILQGLGVNFFEYLKLKLGDRISTAFWDDDWIVGGVLKHRFLRVYALERRKEVSVSSKLSDLTCSLRRNIRGGAEHVQFNSMAELVAAVRLVPQADRYAWSLMRRKMNHF